MLHKDLQDLNKIYMFILKNLVNLYETELGTRSS